MVWVARGSARRGVGVVGVVLGVDGWRLGGLWVVLARLGWRLGWLCLGGAWGGVSGSYAHTRPTPLSATPLCLPLSMRSLRSPIKHSAQMVGVLLVCSSGLLHPPPLIRAYSVLYYRSLSALLVVDVWSICAHSLNYARCVYG